MWGFTREVLSGETDLGAGLGNKMVISLARTFDILGYTTGLFYRDGDARNGVQ